MIRRIALLLLTLVLAGCGGGGSGSEGGGGSKLVKPVVSVAWPALARAFEAPETAQSVTFAFSFETLTKSFTVSRPAGAQSSVQTYVAPEAIPPGSYQLGATFANQDAVVTGRALISVVVVDDGSLARPDGTPLGDIAYEGQIREILVPAADIAVGQSRELTFSATTVAGFALAPPPGALRWEIVSGAEFLRLNADGSFTGLAPGEATVRLTIDHKASAARTILVMGPPPTVRAVPFSGLDMVAEPSGARFWTAARSGQVTSLDPLTLDGITLTVGFDPTVMAISDDGSTMAVGLWASAEVQLLDLRTGVAGPKIALPSPAGSAWCLAFAPGSTSVVAVGTRSTGVSGSAGVWILDGTAFRPNAAQGRDAFSLAWTSPTHLDAVNGSALYDVAVDVNGASLGGHVVANPLTDQRSTRALQVVGGRLYTGWGPVYDPESLAPIGTFAAYGQYFAAYAGPAIDVAHNRAWSMDFTIERIPRLVTYRLNDLKTIDQRPLEFPGASAAYPSALYRWGAKGLAFQSGTSLILIDDAPGL